MQTLPTGEHFEGEFKRGLRHGQGTVTFVSGKVYEGSFVQNRPLGAGKMTTPEGIVYNGSWTRSAGEMQFTGMIIDADGFERMTEEEIEIPE